MKLSEKAMLASLSVSHWTARKMDKQVTDTTNLAHNASLDAGRYNKRLLGKDALAEIVTAVSSARNFHIANTQPWLDEGARILSALRYDEYWVEMENKRFAFDDARVRFLDNYDTFVAVARQEKLGDMYKATDYPSKDDVARRFGFNVRILPLPDAADFRVSVNDDAMARIKADIERSTNEALANATRDVFERVADKVSTMVERLSTADAIFRDTLVSNIADLIDMLPAFNITNDPRITSLATGMKKLVRYDATALREDKAIRREIADDAADILKRVTAYMS